MDKNFKAKVAGFYGIENIKPIPGHKGGRNQAFRCPRGILRVSCLKDRRLEDYLAEVEFVRYLAEKGAPVADVLPSLNGKLVEELEYEDRRAYVSLFQAAPGTLLADNGYRYREGAPLKEYFYNTGQALGRIHRLSKAYEPSHRRIEYFDKYNMDYIHRLIPNSCLELKEAVAQRLEAFRALPMDREAYGLVHFDYSDGNYHVNMENGDITVFDFDNCMYCWYMFDLANLWIHGWGWCMGEQDMGRRREIMDGYFSSILAGYRSETALREDMEEQLQLFIDMVHIENIVDEFECALREGAEVDPEDIENPAKCLIEGIPFAGFFQD